MTSKYNIVSENAEEQTLTVVVADDDRDNLMFISLILDALNLEYYLANDGKTALDLINDKQPDLVLLDIVMPIMNGIEVNIVIKADRTTSRIPTVAITGLAESKHIASIKNAGFDDYIVKPFMIEDLETKLKCLLRINEIIRLCLLIRKYCLYRQMKNIHCFCHGNI